MSSLSVSLEGLSLQLKECIPIMEICLDIAQQLDGCEKQQIIHGDLKPENILLGRNLRTGKRFGTLADWGAPFDSPTAVTLSVLMSGPPVARRLSPSAAGTHKQTRTSAPWPASPLTCSA